MKTLLVVNVLFYDRFYSKGGITQTEICQRTFQSKQTVNLIIKTFWQKVILPLPKCQKINEIR